MRYGPDRKQKTRARILEQAARLFRREGYRGVGIDRIMAAADLTRGGFYAHFRSKSALFREVLRQESDLALRLRSALSAREVITGYLDPDNRDRIGRGCTLATLTNDVPRGDRATRDAFSGLVAQLIQELEAHVPSDAPDRRERALEVAALCVGAISLARGVGDERLARDLLEACRERACAAIAGDGARA